MPVRPTPPRRGLAYGVAVVILKPVLLALTRRRWIGVEHIPAGGGCVVAVNHLSHVDPFTVAHLLHDHGRTPRYLAKASLFGDRRLGAFLRALGQIPVERRSPDAAGAYRAAVEAVRAGECVVVYPEGTLTRDPALWPMTGKTGAARIALETGCPVVPVGQWGAQDILAPYARRPDLLPPKLVTLRVGPPVPLDDLAGAEVTTRAILTATERIMDAITDQVAAVRGEEPPAERYVLRHARDDA